MSVSGRKKGKLSRRGTRANETGKGGPREKISTKTKKKKREAY